MKEVLASKEASVEGLYCAEIKEDKRIRKEVLTLEEAVEEVMHFDENEEVHIVILLPEHGDEYVADFEEVDENAYRNDLLPKNVAVTLLVHKSNEKTECNPTEIEPPQISGQNLIVSKRESRKRKDKTRRV